MQEKYKRNYFRTSVWQLCCGSFLIMLLANEINFEWIIVFVECCLKLMNREQLQNEKLSVQKALLQFESNFGHPVGVFLVLWYLYSKLWLSLIILPVILYRQTTRLSAALGLVKKRTTNNNFKNTTYDSSLTLSIIPFENHSSNSFTVATSSKDSINTVIACLFIICPNYFALYAILLIELAYHHLSSR